jgi:hypothetical protein
LVEHSASLFAADVRLVSQRRTTHAVKLLSLRSRVEQAALANSLN